MDKATKRYLEVAVPESAIGPASNATPAQKLAWENAMFNAYVHATNIGVTLVFIHVK